MSNAQPTVDQAQPRVLDSLKPCVNLGHSYLLEPFFYQPGYYGYIRNYANVINQVLNVYGKPTGLEQ
jgi:hypothetical protein